MISQHQLDDFRKDIFSYIIAVEIVRLYDQWSTVSALADKAGIFDVDDGLSKSLKMIKKAFDDSKSGIFK